MSAVEICRVDLDLDSERGLHRREVGVAGNGSQCSSDGDEGSCDSQFFSTTTSGSSDGGRFNDVLIGERDCRICHMGLEIHSFESGNAIELGCSCKHDLAAAHKHCAEVWFKIKGNKICEICNSIAQNVTGTHEVVDVIVVPDEPNNGALTTVVSAPTTSTTRNFWQGHRVLNFLMACIVFAFVISWLFHFNVPT